MLKEDNFCGGSEYIVSEYEEYRDLKQGNLDNLMKTWYNLPTAN